MPRIVLKPMRDAPLEGGVCVGTIGGEPLTYVGRTPHAGTQPLDAAEIAQDLLQAVEDVCEPLFGGDWLRPLSVVSGLHERSVQRDRIVKYGLPPGVLLALGEAATVAMDRETSRAVGYIMQGVALLYRRHDTQGGEAFRHSSGGGKDPLLDHSRQAVQIAVSLVRGMLDRKPGKDDGSR